MGRFCAFVKFGSSPFFRSKELLFLTMTNALLNTSFLTKRILIITLFLAQVIVLSAQWTATSGIANRRVNSILAKDSKLFAGTDTSGVFVSVDNGLNWAEVNNGLDNHNVKGLGKMGTNLIAAIGNGLSTGAIYVSTNNGVTWSPSTTKYYGFLFCLTSYNSDLYAGSWAGVIKSSNGGNTWTTLATGLPSNASVSALSFNASKFYSGVISSSVGGTGVFTSTDAGANWAGANSGLTNTNVTALGLSATHVYAGTTTGGVFVSSNNGASWTAANTGLTSTTINCIEVRGTKVFVGTSDGIFMSADNGANWSSINTGLPSGARVFSITFNDPYMYVGTLESVYRRAISQVTGLNEETPMEFKLSVYPNPSAGNIVISSQQAGIAIITNELGQTVAEVSLHAFNNYTATCQNLQYGVYFISTTSGNKTTRQKFVVVN